MLFAVFHIPWTWLAVIFALGFALGVKIGYEPKACDPSPQAPPAHHLPASPIPHS